MNTQSMPLRDALAMADAAVIDPDQARAALETLRDRIRALERLATGSSRLSDAVQVLEDITFDESDAYQHILAKSRDAAANGWGVLSEGEKVAAALVLDRPDWLAERRYTLGEAIDRVGVNWCRLIPRVARELAADVARMEPRTARAQEVIESTPQEQTINYRSELITYGEAPGYRDASFIFNLHMVGAGSDVSHRARISIRPEDAEGICRHLRDVHRFAWSRGAPLDVMPGESRPTWFD